MQEIEELSPLLLSLYRGARELPRGAFEEFAIGQIKPMLGFESAVWGQGQTDGHGVSVSWAHQHDIDPDAVRIWEQISAKDRLVPLTVSNLKRTVRSHTATLFEGPDGAACRDYAARFGCEQVLIMTVPDGTAGDVRWMATYRADPNAHYTERERLLCDALIPHLMEALSVNRLATHPVTGEHAERAGESNPLAVAEESGRVCFAQQAFLELLAAEWAQVDAFRLPLPLLEAINGRHEAFILGRAVCCRLRRRSGMLIVELRRLTPLDRLPPQRSRVAWLFALGYSNKEVAREMRISPSTVRNQLAAAYHDLNIGSRAQLMRLSRAEP